MSVVVVVGWRVPLANLPFLGYEPLVPTNPSLTLAPSNNPKTVLWCKTRWERSVAPVCTDAEQVYRGAIC